MKKYIETKQIEAEPMTLGDFVQETGRNPYGKDIENHKETEKGYEVDMDLPGFKKDEIKASVENGYLTISAARGLDEDEKDKKSGKYIRRERYAGACERSFYVGEGISQDDIKASFQHGILKLFIPKEPEKSVEEKKYVAIEG